MGAQPRYTFTGKQRDGGTGQYYFNARYYEATIGRFTASDPARDGLNWYPYVRGNPLRFIDPDGRRAMEYGYTVPKEPLRRLELMIEVFESVYGDGVGFGRGMVDFNKWKFDSLRLGDESGKGGSELWKYVNKSLVADLLAAADGLYPNDPDVRLWNIFLENKDQTSFWAAHDNSINVAAASD